MIKPLLLFLVLISSIAASGQEGTPGQIRTSSVQVRDIKTRSKQPVKRPCLLWLPASYSDNSNSPFYPLLVFLHSSKGGRPSDGTNINAVRKNGPFYFLQNKTWNGTAGYGGNCGQTGFIIFAMQSNAGSTVDVKELDYAITQLLLRYRIDETRIIFTGIDKGAESIIHFILDSAHTNQPRLILPMSIPIVFNSSGLTKAAKRGINLWAFTFDKDEKAGIDFKSNTVRLVNDFNKAFAHSAKLTIKPGTNCCWNKYYDPVYKEADTDSSGQSLNMYEWIMKKITWGNASPPIYACDEYVTTPNKFAGYISIAKRVRKDVVAASCKTPVYTIDGKINTGSIIYLQKSDENFAGNNMHYGFSTSKLKGAIANRHLIINPDGKVTTYE